MSPIFTMTLFTAPISISELNRLTRQTLEQTFPLLWVTGEVSNLTRATSGHIYFTLKDNNAQARCVMFRTRIQLVPWRIENGQQVEARALVSLYEPRGDFQLNIETLRRAGLGRLFEAFSQLKQKLETAGLFASERKKPIPTFPHTIGIISSPKAAALQDVLTTLQRRAPHISVVLYPTPVQGDLAAISIANTIALANQRHECNVLLLVRGGGSIEDLWSFNEEIVANAIAISTIPIISGVGHETDATIADFVADLRAPTPTAAAEIATQYWYAQPQKLISTHQKLLRTMHHQISINQQRVDHLGERLVNPRNALTQRQTQISQLETQLKRHTDYFLQKKQHQLNRLSMKLSHAKPRTQQHQGQITLLDQRFKYIKNSFFFKKNNILDQISEALEHLNPENTLSRGFAIIRDGQGHVISNVLDMTTGQLMDIELASGRLKASVLSVTPHTSKKNQKPAQ